MNKNFLKAAILGSALLLANTNTNAQTIKIFCWNVLSLETTAGGTSNPGHSVTPYVNAIKLQNPDIICMNEFTTGGNYSTEKMAEFEAAMNMMGYFIKSYVKNNPGYYGNVILSKYPIIASDSHRMDYKHINGEGNYQSFGYQTGKYLEQYGADQRSVGYADIAVPVSEGSKEYKIVRIVCSHFDHEGPETIRTNHANESVAFCSLDNPPYPTIMCGDLNTSNTGTLSPLMNLGDQIGYHWVDHIFAFPKGAWTKVSFESPTNVYEGKTLSDHQPVVAVVTLK